MHIEEINSRMNGTVNPVRKVKVVAYNTQWPKLFEQEAAKLRGIFGTNLAAIHHIGSTSVKGLKAKPVIDIMPVVKDIRQVDALNKQMMEIGYEPKGEHGIPGRRFFQKGGDVRTHHVHVFEQGSPDVDRHLAFRDYLQAHPDAVKTYGNKKMSLARRFPDVMDSYFKGKEELVKTIEAEALEWYRRKAVPKRL